MLDYRRSWRQFNLKSYPNYAKNCDLTKTNSYRQKKTRSLGLGHDLQILKRVAGGGGLCLLGRGTTAVANGNRQRRQLHQTLEAAAQRLLVNVNVRDLKALLGGDVVQHLDKVNGLVVQASVLGFWEKSLMIS